LYWAFGWEVIFNNPYLLPKTSVAFGREKWLGLIWTSMDLERGLRVVKGNGIVCSPTLKPQAKQA